MFLHKKNKNIDIAKKSYFKIGEKSHPEIEKFPEKTSTGVTVSKNIYQNTQLIFRSF